MNIQQIREAYPEYNKIPDARLAELLRAKFMPEQGQEDFNRSLGLQVPEGGFVASVKSGFQNLAGQAALTAGKAGVISTKDAAQFAADRRAAGERVFKPAESFTETPGQYLSELVGGSLPYLAAPLAAAVAAKPLGLGVLGASLGAGSVSGLQYIGSNLDRTIGTGKTLDEASGTKAVLAAIPQAALDIIGLRFIPGIGKLFGATGQRVTSDTARQYAEQTARQIAGAYAKSTGRAMTVGGLTEAMQQTLERAQADLSVTDPEARSEQLESFFGGAFLGGVLGGPGTFVQRSGEISQSNQMAGAEADAAAQAQAAQDALLAQEQAVRDAANSDPRQMGPTRRIGAQQQIEGIDAVPERDVEDAPSPEDMLQERTQLEALINNPDAVYDRERAALRRGDTTGTSAVQTLREAKTRVAEIDKDPLVAELRGGAAAQTAVSEKLRKAQMALTDMASQDDASYDPDQVDKLKRKIAKLSVEAEALGGAQDSFAPDLFGTVDVNQRSVRRNVEADRSSLGQDIGEQREQQATRRQEIEQEIEALRSMGRGDPKDPTAATNIRASILRQRALQAELTQIEQQAAGTAEMAQQPRLFGDLQDRIGTGTAGTARSEAEVLTDLDMARASRNKERVGEIVEELRSVRQVTGERNQNAKAQQTDASELNSRELENATGMKMPAQPAQRQAATDARYRSFGQFVSILDRFNKGTAARGDLVAAEKGVADNLIDEIQSIKGEPLSTMERQNTLAELRPLLGDLKRRFGDTRDMVNTGTRKDPQFEGVQNADGSFRTDLPGTGAGPQGMGLENAESRPVGQRTLGNRYAASQSILEGIDQIRNRRVGQQETAPGIDRTDSNQDQDTRLATAAQGAQGTPAQELVQQVRDSRVKTPALVDSAVETGMRAGRGQDFGEQQQAITAELQRLDAGQRSETEGGATAVQGEMFGGKGTLFDTFAEFETYLAGDALAALKMAHGQTRETVARVAKLAAPLQARASELEAQAQKLIKDRADLLELSGIAATEASAEIRSAEANLRRTQALMEDSVAEYRTALLDAQLQLSTALQAEAEVAREIANNAQALTERLQAVDGVRNSTSAAARTAHIEFANAAEGLATAKEALSQGAARTFQSVEPLDRPKLAAYRKLEDAVKQAQKRIGVARTKAQQTMSRVVGASREEVPSDAFLQYLLRDAELFDQRRSITLRLGGLTSTRNRAQAALEQAQTLIEALTGAPVRTARERLALANSLQGNANDTAREFTNEATALGTQAGDLNRQAQGLRRVAAGTPTAVAKPTAPKETQGAREARDGVQRAAEQKRLEMLQGTSNTDRESVSFESRRQDQAELDEAGARMRDLEEMLARVPTNEEQRAVFDAAAKEYAQRVAQLEKKAQVRLESIEGKISAQNKRIEQLKKAQAAYDAADVGTPARENAGQRVAALTKQVSDQGIKISKALGIKRERLMTRVEKQAQAAAPAKPLAPGREIVRQEQIEEIAAGQTSRRTSSPLTRETRQTGGLRTGDLDTVDDRAGEERARLTESRRVRERDVQITSAEQQSANVTAEKIKADTAAANKAAAELQAMPPATRAKKANEARAVATALLSDKTPKVRKSRTASAIEDSDPLDFDDALMREDNATYDERKTTDLTEKMAEAASDGRTLDLVDELVANGSTPFVRDTAARLRPLLLRTKLKVSDGMMVDGERVEGTYTPITNTVEIDSMAMTEETLLHELTHAATMRALEGNIPLDATQQQALADLQTLYNDVKDRPEFKREYAKKDLREFVSELLSNQQVRDKIDTVQNGGLLSRIYDAIRSLLGLRALERTPADSSAKAVADAYKLFAPSREFRFRNNAVASIMRGVFPDNTPRFSTTAPRSVQEMSNRIVGRQSTFSDKVLANLGGFRVMVVDKFDSYEKLNRQGVARSMLTDLEALNATYFMRMGEQHAQFTEMALTQGVPQLQKIDNEFVFELPRTAPPGGHASIAKVGQALSTASIGNDAATESAFSSYLAVLRADQVGYDKLNFDATITPAMGAQLKADINANPATKAAFEKARDIYRQYNNNLLDATVQMGFMTKAKGQELKNGVFIPYYRQESSGMVNLILAGEKPVRIGNIRDQPHLAELVGGNEKILPFFTGAYQNTSLLLSAALRNKQIMEMSNMISTLGIGKIRSGIAPDSGNTVNFMIDGEQVHLFIDDAVANWGVSADLLIKGLEGIKTTLPAALRLLQLPANLLRLMVTRNPAYPIRQLIRDSSSGWLLTGGNFTPVISSVRELSKMRVGRDAGTSAGAQALERSGAVSSNVITGDLQDRTRILRSMARQPNPLQRMLSAVDKFAIQGDTATRAVLYDSFRKQGMTHRQAVLGALESMNFSRRGLSPSMQMMSMVVPFFNAQIQGLDVIYRTAKGQTTFNKKLDIQRKLLARGALVMAGTVAYAAMMQDDETYKNATAEERALNFFLPLPGTEESFRIPIPYELGYAFKALPELFFNVAAGDTKTGDAAKTIGKLAYATVPGLIPQGVKPAIEVIANYSFFSFNSIEGQRDRMLQKAERYRDNTSELSKLLGKNGAVSPIQLDYLIRSYTGGLGLALVGLSNFAVRPLNPSENLAGKADKTLSELPFIGALFQPVDGRGVIEGAFKDIQSFQRASATYKRMLEQGRQADAQRFLQEFGQLLALNSYGGAFKQQMGELATVRRAILADRSTDGAQKRLQVAEIRKVEIQLAQQVRDAARQASD